MLFEVIRSEQICFIMLQVELKPQKISGQLFQTEKENLKTFLARCKDPAGVAEKDKGPLISIFSLSLSLSITHTLTRKHTLSLTLV